MIMILLCIMFMAVHTRRTLHNALLFISVRTAYLSTEFVLVMGIAAFMP
jgi:hypothetical protein